MRKKLPQDYHGLALSKNGMCLHVGINANDNATIWRCDKQHEWNATYGSVQAGTWCPYCSGRAPINDDRYHALAATKQGKCLVIGTHAKDDSAKWECSNGHVWNARFANIQNGQWCPYCSNHAPKADSEYHILAKSHSGECLQVGSSTQTKDATWKCSENHIWIARYANIQQGQWCPKCATTRVADKQKLAANDYHELALRNNGKCLLVGKNTRDTTSIWQCSTGHKWHASYGNTYSGCWCPTCSTSKSERKCRQSIEEIIGVPFPKKRPMFLRKGNSRLELDGFNESLKVAFEYQGEQHYSPRCFGNVSKAVARNNLRKQKRRDAKKRKLCSANGVTLIEVPFTTKPGELLDLVLGVLAEYGRNDILELIRNRAAKAALDGKGA